MPSQPVRDGRGHCSAWLYAAGGQRLVDLRFHELDYLVIGQRGTVLSANQNRRLDGGTSVPLTSRPVDERVEPVLAVDARLNPERDELAQQW